MQQSDTRVIAVAAKRVRRFGEAIDQAHRLGHGPGDHSSAISLGFQRSAVPVYARCLPWSYLCRLAAKFEVVASIIDETPPPDRPEAPGLADSWRLLCEYLNLVAIAIIEAAPAGSRDRAASQDPEISIEPRTPSVMAFADIAQMLGSAAAAELVRAGREVQVALEWASSTNPLSTQEQQLLRALAGGDRVIDIAHRLGYSQRSVYRILGDLRKRLGVDNNKAVIAVASAEAWI